MVNVISSLIVTAGFVATVVGETVHGVVVLTRHGDRTTKHYTPYHMTNLGFDQVFHSGSLYRERYISATASNPILNISTDTWKPSQVYASSPDQEVLMNTGTAFLQGLYPPTQAIVATDVLNNGTSTQKPLNGYQYVVLHSENTNSPDTIWLKGDDACPSYTKSASSYNTTTQFKELKNSTAQFYQQFDSYLTNIYPNTSQVSYANAYDIYDLLHVGSIHNTSDANITSDQMFQLRTLADKSEFNRNYSPDDEARSIGGRTFANAVLVQFNQTVTSNASLKFSLFTGSYDTFLAFAGITNLTTASSDFYGLPDYASTMVFELFTHDNMTSFPSNKGDLRVRFMFRNGSNTELNTFPLFGGSESDLSYTDFVSKMSALAISKVSTWCSMCQSTQAFCPSSSTTIVSPSTPVASSGSHLSNAAAGGIGAGVTLGVILLCALAFLLFRRLFASKKTTPTTRTQAEKDLEVASSNGSH